jgi:predicted amino acid racemase
MPSGNILIGATSDHLVVGTQLAALKVGSEMRFQMNYSALMHAMAAPDIQTKLLHSRPAPQSRDSEGASKHLALV